MNAYTVEARSHPRFKLQIDISINSGTCGRLKGYTLDISESEIAAMLTLDAPLGEMLARIIREDIASARSLVRSGL